MRAQFRWLSRLPLWSAVGCFSSTAIAPYRQQQARLRCKTAIQVSQSLSRRRHRYGKPHSNNRRFTRTSLSPTNAKRAGGFVTGINLAARTRKRSWFPRPRKPITPTDRYRNCRRASLKWRHRVWNGSENKPRRFSRRRQRRADRMARRCDANTSIKPLPGSTHDCASLTMHRRVTITQARERNLRTKDSPSDAEQRKGSESIA